MSPRPRRIPLAAVVAGFVSLLSLACGAPATTASRPNVILVILDTVRADHLSLYGYERPTTPALERWAGSATVFEHGYSAAAWTLPGVGSILTGLYPSQHGAGVSGPTKMHDDVPRLAELVAAEGYATGAVANVSFLSENFGLDRGFEHYDFDPAGDVNGTRRADENVDRALEWLANRDDRPWLFMLHLFDAHRHYDAPEPARGRFTEQYADGYDPDTLDDLESRLEAERRGDLDFHVAAYDEEILWLDMQLDRFFGELERRGQLDDTLVVLTGDHGEAFREHDAIAHGGSLHNEVIRVPFVIWEPGRQARGRHPGPVSTVDIVPTVLAAIGAAPTETAGIDLLPIVRGEELPARALFAQNRFYNTDLSALIRWPTKLIVDHQDNRRMLYDLESDPGELVDLWDPDDSDVRRLTNSLRREARDFRQGRPGDAVEMTPEVAERLRALGYIE